jgi:hypothetical protein
VYVRMCVCMYVRMYVYVYANTYWCVLVFILSMSLVF